jgi:hypothetical protein
VEELLLRNIIVSARIDALDFYAPHLLLLFFLKASYVADGCSTLSFLFFRVLDIVARLVGGRGGGIERAVVVCLRPRSVCRHPLVPLTDLTAVGVCACVRSLK